MKSFIIFLFIIVTFNACSVTNHYRVTSDLKFEAVPKDQRITYVYFSKDKFVKVQEQNTSNDKEDFLSEFKEEKEISDPFESYNRLMTTFNDKLYINVLDPTARAYANVVPENARVGISNFFDNITFPIRFINNILQFKFDYAAEETGRFLINSTVGVLGFMDIAKDYNLSQRDEDFGQTLAYYGFGGGAHIVLPLYGPSNVRDIVGLVADGYVSPLDNSGDLKYKIPENFGQAFAIKSVNVINSTSLVLGQYENLKKDAIDLYPFLRDVYNQNRENQIKE